MDSGIGPEMRPGLITNSVREVRFEMEVGNGPSRPGEFSSPVPRVRAETLRVESEGSREQMMPEKEVQGLVEGEKFQEEKNVEPGRPRRELRMSKRAWVSVGFSEVEEWRWKRRRRMRRE